MKRRIKTIAKWIIIVFVICAIIAASLINYFRSRVKYNDSFVNGNTPGNLYNAGLFCEHNGTIYFANPDDENTLYSMDSNGNNLKKLCSDTIMYINADDNYVYYVRNNTKDKTDFSFFSFNNNSLCRISNKGGDVTILDEDPCIYASLIGNYIYYLHYDKKQATTLYRIKIDGTQKEQVMDHYVFTCSALEDYFYYNGLSDGSIYQYNTSDESNHMIYNCNGYKPILTSENDLYYLDVDDNFSLVHTNISYDNPTVLSDESIDLYNVYGSYIYFQTNSDEPALCRIKNDGSGFEQLLLGTYTNIHVTSQYLYVTDFKTGIVQYTSTSNPGEFIQFHPGVIKE